MSENYNYLFKTVLIGEKGVGKVTLANDRTNGYPYYAEDYKMTIGVEFFKKTIKLDFENGPIISILQLWVLDEQNRRNFLRKMYYLGSLGAILMFDLTNHPSFESLPNWILEVRESMKNDIDIILVGNKSDLTEQRVVSSEEIDEFAKKYNLKYFEISAKTGTNVENMFNKFTKTIIEKRYL